MKRSPRRDVIYTFSLWGTLLGGALGLFPKTRRLGAVLLLSVGYGGLGVAWERACGCDVRRFQRPRRAATMGVVTHLPQLVLGHVALGR